MQVALPPLGMPVTQVVGPVERVVLVVDACARAVAESRVEVAPVGLQLFQPYRNIGGKALFPAEDVVPDDQLRDEVHLSVLVARADGHARGILLPGHRVQLLDVRGGVVAAHALVAEQPPHRDRGVVVVLRDHLAELLHAVGAERLGADVAAVGQIGRAHEGQVAPDDQPAAVAFVVKLLRVRSRRGAYRVDAHLDHVVEVFADLVFGQRRAHARTVFVIKHAVQLQRPSVEREARFRVDREVTQPQRHCERVAGDVLVGHFDDDVIEVGVFHAVPQRRGLQFDRDRHRADARGRHAEARGLEEDRIAARRGDCEVHQQVAVSLPVDTDDRIHCGPFRGDRFLHEADAAFGGADDRLLGDDQLDVAVEAAVDVVVARGGQYVHLRRVVDDHPDRVRLAEAQVGRQLEGEAGEAAPVLAHMAAVHGEVRHVARRAEADEDPLAAPFGRNLDILDVVADAAVVVVVAAERVAVPGVRQVHHRGVVAGVAVAEKAPVAVDVDHFARPGLQGAPCEQRTQQQGEDQGSVFHRKSHRERYFNVPAAGFVPQFGGTGRSFLYAGRSPGYSARWIGPAGCLRRSVRSAYRSTPPGPQAARMACMPSYRPPARAFGHGRPIRVQK